MTFGTAYYPDYYPEAEWERDLEKMRAAGLRTVRILEFAWCWIQPDSERWNWAPLDRFLNLAFAKRTGRLPLHADRDAAAVVFPKIPRRPAGEREGRAMPHLAPHDVLESFRCAR